MALVCGGPEAGLELCDFARDGAAREEFESLGKRRAIVPDAFAVLIDDAGRELRLFAEVDLGAANASSSSPSA